MLAVRYDDDDDTYSQDKYFYNCILHSFSLDIILFLKECKCFNYTPLKIIFSISIDFFNETFILPL